MTETSGERAGRGTPGGGARARIADRLGTRWGMAAAALWLLAAALAVRQVAAVLRLPADRRLPELLGRLGPDGTLRVGGSYYDATDPFTGTPFAGLVLTPLRGAAEQSLGVGWTVGSLLLVVAVAALAVRALPVPAGRRTRLLAVPAAFSLLVVSSPVRTTLTLGQSSVLPVLLVLVGWLVLSRSDRRSAGVLVGVAAALQPAALLFAPLLWLTGRRTAAGAAAGAFAACTAAAWALMPQDSRTYWLHHIAGAGLGDPSDALANQSLHGALLRLGLHGPLEIVLFAALAAGVAWLALRRAAHYARDGQPLLAAAVTGCAVVAVSPTAWQHQQLWILLAVAGRVGRRSGDRLIWPLFVIAVMTLDGSALLPQAPVLTAIGDNAPLIAALLAACAIPFLSRDSAHWDRPVPSGPLSRPSLMLELLLIRVGYWVYSLIRGHAPDTRSTAEGHGFQILHLEQALYLDWEHALNLFAVRHPVFENVCNVYYQSLHYTVPVTLLVILYLRRPPEYRRHRAALSFATLLGLIGFWLYPLAPPRLMPGLGFVDTAHGPQDLTDPDFGALTELSNQYAAMPSLHVGWSLWCAVVILSMTRNRWLRALGVAYPLLTTLVVMTTANHYLLDAFGGAAVVAAGYSLQHALFRLRGVPNGTESSLPAAGAAGAAGVGRVPVGESAERDGREPAVQRGGRREGSDPEGREEDDALRRERDGTPLRRDGGAVDVDLHRVQQQRRDADHGPVHAGADGLVGVVLQDGGRERDERQQDQERDVQPEQR